MVRRGSRQVYVIDEKILKTNWSLFGDDFRCHLCSEKFVQGDTIYAIYNKNVKWYHKKCYEITLYDG